LYGKVNLGGFKKDTPGFHEFNSDNIKLFMNFGTSNPIQISCSRESKGKVVPMERTRNVILGPHYRILVVLTRLCFVAAGTIEK
jgi:hypothetical protein